MKNLIEIIEELKLFKGTCDNGTDKHFVHNYINAFYQKEFEKIQSKELRILEIGTYTGASLKLWKTFFVNSVIEGVDIADKTLEEYRDKDIIYHIGDAYSEEFLKTLDGKKYDIIIDDGPHTESSQLFFTENYYRFLNKDGYFIIEDIHSDSTLEIIKNKLIEIFEITPFIYDKRKETGLNNETLLAIKI